LLWNPRWGPLGPLGGSGLRVVVVIVNLHAGALLSLGAGGLLLFGCVVILFL
jgi:hypothetical protein